MAAFSFSEFYQRNRRVVIWVILFLLLWLLRDFFGLVFLSFVLAIIAAPIAEFGERRLKLPHWLSLALVYLLFLILLASFVRFVVPSVASEVNRMIGNLPATEVRLIEAKNRLVDRYPTLRQPLSGFLASARANVDFLKLSPGDESPFVIDVEAPANVARYRVSFRNDAGIVPHVDRRGQQPLALSTVR